MKSYPSTDLKQHVGDVLAAAAAEPVVITRNHKPRYVLMTVEEFERRRPVDDPRKAYRVGDMPDDLADVLLQGLDRQLKELGDG